MKRFILTLSIVFFSIPAAHALDWVEDITLSPMPLAYSGPADSVVPGKTIGPAWSSSVEVKRVFWCGYIFTCSLGTMEPGSSVVSSGMTIDLDGVNYTIFETGVPGVGFILGLKDTNATKFIPLQNGQTQTYPTEDTNGVAYDLGWSAKVTFIKTGQTLASGVYQTGTIVAAVLTAHNNETKTAQVVINPTTIEVKATGCTVATKTASVDLGTIDIRTLPTVGSSTQSGSFDVELSCDEKVAVNAVITDQSNPSNHSSTVTLTGDSTAYGVGVEFFFNGSGPLQLGPDSPGAGTLNQFFIQSTDQAQILSLPFEARFVRTGELIPGRANALASITFSYQ